MPELFGRLATLAGAAKGDGVRLRGLLTAADRGDGRDRTASRPGSTINRIIIAVRQAAFRRVLSEAIVTELQRTLANPYYTLRISPEDALDYELFPQDGHTRLDDDALTGVATHPEEDPILAITVSAGVDYLVTGDQHLRRLGAIEDIPIISSADFVAHPRPPALTGHVTLLAR